MEWSVNQQEKRKDDTTIQFNISFNDAVKLPIISGGQLNLKIEIKNEADREIEIPKGGTTEPKYYVKLPEGREIMFSAISTSFSGEVSSNVPSLIKVAPSETYVDYISVECFVDITSPGYYEIRGTLDWEEFHAKAASLNFEVIPARFEGVAVSQGRHEKGKGGTEVLLLQRSPRGLEEIIAFYKRKTPVSGLDMVGFEIGDLVRRGPLPDNVIRILAPYLNFKVSTYLFRWIISYSIEGINVGHDEGPELSLITSEYRILDILDPLAIRTPALFFFAIIRDGKSLFHLSFANLLYPVSPKGIPIAESIPKTVPFKNIFEMEDYVSSSAALGPHALGSPLVAGLAMRSEDLTGTEFILLKVSHDGEIEAKKSFDVPGVTPLKGMTLNINTEGKLRASLLVKEKKSDAVRLVEVMGTYDLTTMTPAHIIPVIGRLDPDAKLDLRSFEDHGGRTQRILLIRQPGKPAMVFDEKESVHTLENDLPYDRPVELVLSSNGWNAVVMYSDHVEVVEMAWF